MSVSYTPLHLGGRVYFPDFLVDDVFLHNIYDLEKCVAVVDSQVIFLETRFREIMIAGRY